MVEMMVVIVIIAIMSVAATVGWKQAQSSTDMNRAGGVIKDIIRNTGLELSGDEYKTATISLLPDFLVIEYEQNDTELGLLWDESKCEGCGGLVSSDTGRLMKGVYGIKTAYSLGAESNAGSISNVRCIPDFYDTQDIRWNYRLNSDSMTSSLISIVHFNLNRSANNFVSISNNGTFTPKVVIKNGGIKSFFNSNGERTDKLIITYTNNEKTDSVTIR